jgi:hypothetical protein
MKDPLQVVGLVTVVLFLYAGMALLGGPEGLMLAIFLASPFLVIWMVVRVLKAKPVNEKTFDEYFYQDHPYRRSPDQTEA